jgi:hypothetical protein
MRRSLLGTEKQLGNSVAEATYCSRDRKSTRLQHGWDRARKGVYVGASQEEIVDLQIIE